MLLGPPTRECSNALELSIGSIKSQLKAKEGDFVPESETDNNLKIKTAKKHH